MASRYRYKSRGNGNQTNQLLNEGGGDDGGGYDALFRQRNQLAAEQYQKDMAAQQKRMGGETSIHELLKDELYRPEKSIVDGSGFKFQLENPTDMMKTITNINEFGVSDRYFYLDSSNSEIVSVTNEGTLVFYLNKLAALEPIENIIEMEITGFFMEKVPTGDERLLPERGILEAPTTRAPVELITKGNYSRMISILVEEAQSQSVIVSNNNRFHFLGRLMRDSLHPQSRYYVEPVIGKYIFTKPIIALEKITLSFRNPLNIIKLNSQILEGEFQSSRTTTPLIADGGDIVQAIFWIKTIKSTSEYVKNGIYYVKLTDISSLTYNDGIFALINNKSVFQNLSKFLLREEGHVVRFELIDDANVVNKPRFPPPLEDENDKVYAYFRFLAMSPTNEVGLANRAMARFVPRDRFFNMTLSAEHRRLNFGLRLRTIRATSTNKITPV